MIFYDCFILISITSRWPGYRFLSDSIFFRLQVLFYTVQNYSLSLFIFFYTEDSRNRECLIIYGPPIWCLYLLNCFVGLALFLLKTFFFWDQLKCFQKLVHVYFDAVSGALTSICFAAYLYPRGQGEVYSLCDIVPSVESWVVARCSGDDVFTWTLDNLAKFYTNT
jgi:hypothetical protein